MKQVLVFLAGVLLLSCAVKKDHLKKPLSSQKKEAVKKQVDRPATLQPDARTAEFVKYKIKLRVDSPLRVPGFSGKLRVRIINPDDRSGLFEKLQWFLGKVPHTGRSARVQIFSAPSVLIKPLENVCLELSPAGAELPLRVLPEKEEIHKISARVEMFDSEKCSGVPVWSTVKEDQTRVLASNSRFLTWLNDLSGGKTGRWLHALSDGESFEFWMIRLILPALFIVFLLWRRIKKSRLIRRGGAGKKALPELSGLKFEL